MAGVALVQKLYKIMLNVVTIAVRKTDLLLYTIIEICDIFVTIAVTANYLYSIKSKG